MGNIMRIRRLTILGMFVAIELVMAVTPIGFINLGAIAITTMHIPVIFIGMLLGPLEGASLGFVFGLTSFLKATFAPNLTSFCFSPFYSAGAIHGNFWSLLIAFVPRILLGYLSGLLFAGVKRSGRNCIFAELMIAVGMTFLHTVTVMGAIWLFFGDVYAAVTGVPVAVVIMAVLTSNGLLEMAAAGMLIPMLMRILRPVTEKLDLG